ncbi:hypothetical protein CBR_g51260 [Chara braunii]|uniref:Uncharacterized protein n=1 Tax=Chara braunii TaxID=69332 RepID=A0A388M842_CHABU|nr:hypothetical protein CBR_g51260 [Chara braunii]|eukprot:GBG90754.1 hypothetical protein CBR_g51260 [Chara braunii]
MRVPSKHGLVPEPKSQNCRSQAAHCLRPPDNGTNGKLGKREDTIIRARAVVRFIREYGAALSLYRRFSAAHPSSASAVAASSSVAPPLSQRRGRELVYPAQARFATHYLMLERLLDRRRALEALIMSDDWLRTAWRRFVLLQARWVRHQVLYAPFWEHVENIVELMMPVMQLLCRLDRGGRVMTRMWSWALAMVDRVARARQNRPSMEKLNIIVQAYDLAVESEPGDSDDDRDDGPLAETLRPRTCAFTASAVPRPLTPPPPPSSAPASTTAAAQHPLPPTDRPGHGEQGTQEIVDEGDDDDDGDREGYESSSEDEDDPGYSPTQGRGDDDGDSGDGTHHAGGLQTLARQRADRCSGAGRGGSGAGRGVGVHDTQGVQAVVAEDGRGEREVGAGSAKFGAPSAEAAAEAAPAAAEFAPASEEVAGGFSEVVGEAAQVRRASTQLGASFSGILDVSLGLPPTPAGKRGSGDADAAATPVCQILRDIPSCSMGDISSSMLQEAAEGTQGSSGQQERAVGNDGDCRHVHERAPESEQDRIDREERERAQYLASRCEMTQSIASRAQAERMLETGGSEGHRATDDAVLEYGSTGGGDAGERPASPVQGVCILPIGGAMTAGELERQAREDPLQANRRGRMDEASRRLMAEGLAYVSCSPSLPSSATGATTPGHAEGPITGRIPAWTPAESPSPKSRKKKMRASKSLSTVRRVTQTMRESQPGLAGLHPRTREALAGDVVAETAGWRERASTRATEQPI